MKKRNSLIDLLRFIAALAVMTHHSYLLGANKPYFLMGGYMMVEFFFYLTGYFAIKKLNKIKIENDTEKYTIKFVFDKFKKIYFYLFITIIIHYLFVIIFKGNDILGTLKNMPFELLLMNITTCSNSFLIIPLWYLSALLFGLPIFVYTYLKKKEISENILCWILPCLIYGFICKKVGYLAGWDTNFIILSSGFLRCIAGLFIGELVFIISEKLRQYDFKKYIKISLTFISMFFGILIFNILCTYYATNYDFLVATFIIIILIFIFSNQTYLYIPENKLCTYLGSLSLPMYISHFTIGIIINYCVPWLKFRYQYILYIIVTIICSIILKHIYDYLSNKSIKNLIIKK